jgi:4-hydroxymandelate oxidase
VTMSMVGRAETAGCAALVVTLDVPIVGERHRDLQHDFDRFAAAPPAITADPVFLQLLASRSGTGGPEDAKRLLDDLFPVPELRWEDLEQFIAGVQLPVLAKGILSADDAVRAAGCGAAGVIVSAHGGRQSERLPAAIDQLSQVVEAVSDRIPVLFDSGVRSGGQAATALALGAQAVLVGRPVLWGLAAGGMAGARRVLELLIRELRTTMILSGAQTVGDLRSVRVLDVLDRGKADGD